MTRYNRLREITIKKTAIFLIETPIFCQNMGKKGLLESYDQKICGFIDRNPGRELYPETALTRHSSIAQGTTAGEYALPAVQSKQRELRRRLAPLALCPRVRNRKTPRSFQSRNLTEVSVFSAILPHFQYSSVRFH